MLIVIEARPEFLIRTRFYHAKMALIIRDQGFIHAFPWLPRNRASRSIRRSSSSLSYTLIPFVTLWSFDWDENIGRGFGLLAFHSISCVEGAERIIPVADACSGTQSRLSSSYVPSSRPVAVGCFSVGWHVGVLQAITT